MRDLVESVIDGILQREQMQQHAKRSQARQSSSSAQVATTPRAVQSFTPNHASLHAVGSQTAVEHKQRDPELWKVSQQFEAIFVQQMLSEMRKTVHKSDFMPSGFAEDVHASMMDDAVAQSSVKQSSFGIAENIYRQLERTQNDMKHTQTAQEISATADKLNKAQNLATDMTLEVNRHAH